MRGAQRRSATKRRRKKRTTRTTSLKSPRRRRTCKEEKRKKGAKKAKERKKPKTQDGAAAANGAAPAAAAATSDPRRTLTFDDDDDDDDDPVDSLESSATESESEDEGTAKKPRQDDEVGLGHCDEEERASIEESLDVHVDAPRTQRRHVADVVEAVVKVNDPWQKHVATTNPGVASTAEVDGDQPKGSDVGSPTQWVTTIVTSEDCGGNFSWPAHDDERPGADFCLSNCESHAFNVRDVGANKIHVCFCEAGKACRGGDATCSLRWTHHALRRADFVGANVEPPRVLLRVMDDCSGQNESNACFRFGGLSAMTCCGKVVLANFKRGHSRFKPDVVVAHVKHRTKGVDVCSPKHLLKKLRGAPHPCGEHLFKPSSNRTPRSCSGLGGGTRWRPSVAPCPPTSRSTTSAKLRCCTTSSS